MKFFLDCSEGIFLSDEPVFCISGFAGALCEDCEITITDAMMHAAAMMIDIFFK